MVGLMVEIKWNGIEIKVVLLINKGFVFVG